MKTTTAARLAWPLAGLALGLVAATVWLVILNRSVLESVSDANPIETITPIGYALAGAVVASRRPRNPIGWIFLAIAVIAVLPGPPLLADKGLAEALAAQGRKAAVPVSVDPDGIGRYPQEIEPAVYFCCLDALQNIAKYPNASRVVVRLGSENGMLRFAVEDDGAGFDPKATQRGSGLQNMADRLEALGGSLEISSARGAGTTVIGWVPVGGERP